MSGFNEIVLKTSVTHNNTEHYIGEINSGFELTLSGMLPPVIEISESRVYITNKPLVSGRP